MSWKISEFMFSFGILLPSVYPPCSAAERVTDLPVPLSSAWKAGFVYDASAEALSGTFFFVSPENIQNITLQCIKQQ